MTWQITPLTSLKELTRLKWLDRLHHEHDSPTSHDSNNSHELLKSHDSHSSINLHLTQKTHTTRLSHTTGTFRKTHTIRSFYNSHDSHNSNQSPDLLHSATSITHTIRSTFVTQMSPESNDSHTSWFLLSQVSIDSMWAVEGKTTRAASFSVSVRMKKRNSPQLVLKREEMIWDAALFTTMPKAKICIWKKRKKAIFLRSGCLNSERKILSRRRYK